MAVRVRRTWMSMKGRKRLSTAARFSSSIRVRVAGLIRTSLGVLQASTGANLLDPGSWKKYDHPFFKQDPKAGVYATGHNGFFRSLDGKQDWIIYHANSAAGQGCGGTRSPRMQPFTWNPDGTPNFGTPIPAGQMLNKPGN